MTARRWALAFALGGGLGCASRRVLPDAGSSSGAATGSSTGQASGVSSGSGSGSGTTGGAGTSGGRTSPYPDGGYVFCFLPSAADAGPTGDGGPAHWLCHPGTYFCDLSGDLGNCYQCRSDSDCADESLPTYDPLRPRCDLDSGIAGYQSFCQQCLGNPDCAGNPAGGLCDLNPNFPPNGLEAPIETLGFEACGELVTDCRLLDGPVCRAFNESCNPDNGRCEDYPVECVTDQDCADSFMPLGALTVVLSDGGSPYLRRPFCVKGRCNACDGGLCPNNNACRSDTDCGNPTSSPAGLACDPASSACVCTSSSQCGGFWPVCTGLDGGKINGSGQPIGICSCDSDDQCGDGGLACLPPLKEVQPNWAEYNTLTIVPTILGAQAGSNFCGVPCTSPAFRSCLALTGYSDCDPASGLCQTCTTAEECESSLGSGGPLCDLAFNQQPPGFCGCLLDSDCPFGYRCLSGVASVSSTIGACIASFSRCTPLSCGVGPGLDPEGDKVTYFCNWDSGACDSVSNIETFPSCLSSYDCLDGGFCFQGQCVECRNDSDCVASGRTQQTLCCLDDPSCSGQGIANNNCVGWCHSDRDCVGNVLGPACIAGSGSLLHCGCAADAGCPTGEWCEPSTGFPGAGYCTGACSSSSSCPTDFACDVTGTCRSQCLDSRDCDGGLGCSAGVCQPCSKPGDCAAGTICLADGICHAKCDGGECAGGEVCDAFGLAGNGAELCYQCVTPADCPVGEGCNSGTHSCGSCMGPFIDGGPYDCPPDALCTNYWYGGSGVCLQNCDGEPCPDDRPICAVFAALTPDHRYCFGCLEDSDCPDAGRGALCDVSLKRTFTCQPVIP